MTDHPYTREAVERWQQGKINIFDALADLEDQRDEARSEFEVVQTLNASLAGELQKLEKQEREVTAQLFEKMGQMSTIAADCDAWLNNQCDETACEFIEAVRDYAKKAINNDEHL